MKKILNTILVLTLLVLVPAFLVNAENGTNNDTGVITINNAIEGKTYSAYQILKLESYDTVKQAYTYTIGEGWSDFINSSAIKDVYVEVKAGNDGTQIVTWKSIEGETDEEAALRVKTFSQLALEYAKGRNNDENTENDVPVTATQVAVTEEDEDKTTTVTFTGLNLGYYLVDSSVGALCSLTTTKPNATATEKNTEPTVEKEVKENPAGTWGEENSASIGQTIEYKTTITASDGAENYVLYDIMSEGLTYKSVSSVQIIKNGAADSTAVDVDASYYTVIPGEGYTFRIEFAKEFTDTLEAGDRIVVKYTAVLNEKAVIYDQYNENKTWLEYGDETDTTNKTPEDITKTYTYKFDLVKTNSSYEVLTGAEFKLLDSNEEEIKLVMVSTGVYRVATAEEIAADSCVSVIEAGKVVINGLDNGTYYLEETKAPEGYNKLTQLVTVVIDGANLEANMSDNVWDDGGVQVTNFTGNELPITGGMGTVLFVTIGSLMVIGFGVLLVTKLRISKMSV